MANTAHQRKTIIAGNWKMNKTVSEATDLAVALVDSVANELRGQALPEIVLCPTFICLQQVIGLVKGSPISVGAQNGDHRDSGAYTGEVAMAMLKDLGAKYVLIGHSERRQYFGETNGSVNLKVKAAIHHGLIPVMCVGETLEERESGQTDAVIHRQVVEGLNNVTPEEAKQIVVAYEPVWAIGTGKNCEADEANRVCGHIRSAINEIFAKVEDGKLGEGISILYGGSVKASTIDEQMKQEHIDGALVGGASLKVEEFLPIIVGGAKRLTAVSGAV